MTPEELGKIFREAREKQGISIKKANLYSRIHPQVLKDLENGLYDRLAGVYVRGFMKKYAGYLGLDSEDMLRKYDSLSKAARGQDIPPEQAEGTVKKPEKERVPAGGNTKFPLGTAIVLALPLVILVVVSIGKISARFLHGKGEESRTGTVETGPLLERKKAGAASYGTSPVTLTLHARGNVWIKVLDAGKTVFVGTLQRGDIKTLRSEQPLIVWTGKAENLYFKVNGMDVGKVGDGVIRNIQVSKEGIKKGDRWVARFD
ncbi:MAG: DUF4115 domain-containing protein [Candidatus Omnitrophica bacterium]|nr:DUF4115 domain-containing protein [Candidatus Omnitrophota bacterium]